MTFIPEGPIPARIMVVGEFLGTEELSQGRPFVGSYGQELSRMLTDAGIMRSECFLTYACRVRPPSANMENLIARTKKDITPAHLPCHSSHVLPPVLEGIAALRREISEVQPNIIIALGNGALFALTGKWGVAKWRGSLLRDESGAVIVPTLPPSSVISQWALRAVVVQDLRRAAAYRNTREISEPQYQFIIRPSFTTATDTLHTLLNRAPQGELWLDLDLETSIGHISCCGLSWSSTEAICIPFLTRAKVAYWEEEEEVHIVHLLHLLLTHPNTRCRLQNALYDAQYIYRHWLFIPRIGQDTMISWHTLFPKMKKSLDFQASMLCKTYTQWKPEKAVWKEGG